MSTRNRRKFKAEAVQMGKDSDGNDWESRPASDRQVTDELLAQEIELIWEASNRSYGAPRVWAWLRRRQGYFASRKRVARIMAANGWVGISGRARVRTTIVDRAAKAAADLVARDFNPARPDATWVGDITYLQRELAHRSRWETHTEARRAVIRWIEGWYNRQRLHSTLDYMSPIEWEAHHHSQSTSEHTRGNLKSELAA